MQQHVIVLNYVKKVVRVMQKIASLEELYFKIDEIVEHQQTSNLLIIIEILS